MMLQALSYLLNIGNHHLQTTKECSTHKNNNEDDDTTFFFLVRKKKMRTRSLKGIGVSEERKAQIQNLLSVRHFGIVGEKGSGSRSTGSGRLHLCCCTVVVSLLSCVSSSSSPTNPMQHSDLREREREKQRRSSMKFRRCHHLCCRENSLLCNTRKSQTKAK
jgi:hypothetical protein